MCIIFPDHRLYHFYLPNYCIFPTCEAVLFRKLFKRLQYRQMQPEHLDFTDLTLNIVRFNEMKIIPHKASLLYAQKRLHAQSSKLAWSWLLKVIRNQWSVHQPNMINTLPTMSLVSNENRILWGWIILFPGEISQSTIFSFRSSGMYMIMKSWTMFFWGLHHGTRKLEMRQ